MKTTEEIRKMIKENFPNYKPTTDADFKKIADKIKRRLGENQVIQQNTPIIMKRKGENQQ